MHHWSADKLLLKCVKNRLTILNTFLSHDFSELCIFVLKMDDEIFVIGCSWSCESDNFRCSDWNAHENNHYAGVIMGAMASQITSLTIVYSTVYSGADQRKLQSSASLAFVRGIHRRPVKSPHKWPVTQKMFPFDDVIMHLSVLGFHWYDVCCTWHGLYKDTLSALGKSTGGCPYKQPVIRSFSGFFIVDLNNLLNYKMPLIGDVMSHATFWIMENCRSSVSVAAPDVSKMTTSGAANDEISAKWHSTPWNLGICVPNSVAENVVFTHVHLTLIFIGSSSENSIL